MIGGAVFLVPAQIALHLGSWAPLAVLAIALVTLPVALCFAESGSRFEATGGAYLYTRTAFGHFAGFETAWLQWFTRVSSLASVANGVVMAAGFYWSGISQDPRRSLVITALIGVLTLVNLRGIRQSATLVNVLTLSKLAPLAGFLLVAVWSVERQPAASSPPISWNDISTAALLLVFTFGGFDVISVPAGEAISPRRDVPFAFVATIVCVAALLVSVQIVLMGTHPGLADSRTPIADVAQRLAGPAGALAVGIGSIVSMAGNNAGQILSGSRTLFAAAEQGELPGFLARVDPRHRTPVNAILMTSAVALALALTGSFAKLAAVSAIARLVAYVGTAAATLQLRRMAYVPPAAFILPGGPAIPLIAMIASLLLLLAASGEQLFAGACALAAGAVLFACSTRRR